MWTCLEMVLLGKSSLHCQYMSSTWISSGGSLHSQTLLMNQQWQFDPEEIRMFYQLAGVCGSSKRSSLVCFSIQSHKKLWSAKKVRQTKAIEHCCQSALSAKPNEDQQRVARRTNATQHRPLSVALYLYPFQTSHGLSTVHSSKTWHALFSSQFPEKHHMSVLQISSHKAVYRKTISGHNWVSKEIRIFHFRPPN